MKPYLASILAACFLGLAACVSAPTPHAAPPQDAVACATPRGFALTGGVTPLAMDSDVVEVRDAADPEKPQRALSVRLNDEARARVEAYTASHIGDRVTISVAGRMVARLTVRDPIAGPLLITGTSDGDVAMMREKLCGG
jgi:hypothetical protein